MKRTTPLLILAASGLSIAATLLIAGPLDPPAGAVTSSYKTLTEVEPRTLISTANTPGDANSTFKITQPGSYYLGASVQATAGRHGIEIAASNVTIDLGGFALIGLGGTGIGDGITTESPRSHITIRNGSITGWDSDGINLVTGGAGTGAIIESVIVANCGATGIVVAEGSVIRSCTARGNDGAGFSAGDFAVIENCTAFFNQANGFFLGDAPTITNCSAASSGLTGFFTGVSATISGCTAQNNSSHGFRTGDNSSIANSSARANGGAGITGANRTTVTNTTASANNSTGISVGLAGVVTACSTTENGLHGISVSIGGSVTGSSAHLNTSHGILAGSGGTVNACATTSNGQSGVSIGDGGSVIDCTASSNARHGVSVSALSAAIVRGNTCDGNGSAILDGAGVQCEGRDSRIEANHCSGNDVGIAAVGSNNLIAGNTCTNNASNFELTSGNIYGRIVDLTGVVGGSVSGNAATSNLTTSDPWANFAQ